MRLPRGEFDALVDAAAASLPPRFKRYLENVAIIVAAAPTPRQRRIAQVRPGHVLLGLYEGVPRLAREGRPIQVPDTITLFQQALETVSPDRPALDAEVRATLIHEIGHHLGLNEARVRRVAGRPVA